MNLKFSYNLEEFGGQVDLCIDELLNRMIRGTTDACMLVEAEAVKRCPPSSFYSDKDKNTRALKENGEDSGSGSGGGTDTIPLAQSITTQINVDLWGKITGVTGSNLDYAVYVHEGTGREARKGLGRQHDLPWTYLGDDGEFYSTYGQEPKPFLEDAFNAMRKRAEKRIREVVKHG